jgi:hypothetical protein
VKRTVESRYRLFTDNAIFHDEIIRWPFEYAIWISAWAMGLHVVPQNPLSFGTHMLPGEYVYELSKASSQANKSWDTQ